MNAVVQLSGRDITQVVNRTAGMVRDLFNCALGFLSPRLGRWVEPKATNDQIDVFEQALQADGWLTLMDYPHSQGAINTANALELLKDRICSEPDGAERWSELAKKIRVYSFGAGVHKWPEGIDVWSFAHTGDWVARITNSISDLRPWGRYVAPTWLMNNTEYGAHDIAGYRGDFARFWVEHHRDDPEKLAENLAQSIAEGLHPDAIHGEILAAALLGCEHGSPTASSEYKAAFAAAFLRRCNDGAIGAYSVPFAAELAQAAGGDLIAATAPAPLQPAA